MTTLTYSLAQAAEKIPCTERWLADGLRSGRFKGHKIMGRWRLTDLDLEMIVIACRVAETAPVTPSFADSLTPRSRGHLKAQPMQEDSCTPLDAP